jgi:hypothetical protein
MSFPVSVHGPPLSDFRSGFPVNTVVHKDLSETIAPSSQLRYASSFLGRIITRCTPTKASPKFSPKTIIIATALIVAIRTAKWVAKSSTDAQFSDVDVELDKEVSFAARISIRVMHELLRKHESLFPQARRPHLRGRIGRRQSPVMKWISMSSAALSKTNP